MTHEIIKYDNIVEGIYVCPFCKEPHIITLNLQSFNDFKFSFLAVCWACSNDAIMELDLYSNADINVFLDGILFLWKMQDDEQEQHYWFSRGYFSENEIDYIKGLE